MNELLPYPSVMAAADAILQRHDYLRDLTIQVQQIPSPTDAEEIIAHWVASYLRNLGIDEVKIDETNNVYAHIPGTTSQPALMVSAHTDTVFPADTDLSVRVNEKEGIVHGPSIGDNSAGVAALLALAEVLQKLSLQGEKPLVDIWLVANSGEEGLGDLRGMKAAVDHLQRQIGACIVLEGMGLSRIVHMGLGSRRFRVSVSAPGGHSWSDFGSPSAIHILAEIATEITKWTLPKSPRSTLNIGRIEGGRSINTIAQNASFELDLRSEGAEALLSLVQRFEALITQYQKPSLKEQGVRVWADGIGDRPTGQIAADHELVNATVRVLKAGGLEMVSLRTSSTDANIPLSRGIPAVCIGVTEGGGAHRMEEWINSALLPHGVRHLILLTWWSTLWLAEQLDD